jgi:hypothetical protein
MSLRLKSWPSADSLLNGRAVALALGVLAALPAFGQYPGQVSKNSKETPELRSIAVLEWTGELDKPKASRLIPVVVLDGGVLQDGGVYLARPQPLALSGEVEYELDENGKPVGLYDIKNAGQEQGFWMGYGSWKPMPAPKRLALDLAKLDESDAQSDEPVLHRKHHADDAPASGKSGGGSGSSSGSGAGAGAQPADSDPDRPTLHRAPSSGSGSPGTTTGTASNSGTSSGSSTADAGGTSSTNSTTSSNEPTLHKKDSSADSSASQSTRTSAATDDSDRPVLKKSRKKQPEDVGHVESAGEDADPDRPRLKRGKSTADSLGVAPSLMGMPADMQQAVAVSDAKSHPDHPWDFQWSDPADQDKMKSTLEGLARDALGLTPPAPPAPKKTEAGTAAARRAARAAAAATAPEPAPLEDEKFRVFELAYGTGATLVLSAHTDGPLAQEKFVTLVAQPDLYGNVRVLLKSVTDGTHLDQTPRMRLVDAVDALADNRGELLFELRGATQRQFALYRVMRGQAEKLFVSGGADFGIESSE